MNTKNGNFKESEFCKRLVPVARILEDIKDWNIWCCSPIDGDDGKVHIFFSRYRPETGPTGWLTACEIAHAVADRPEGPFKVLGPVLKPRGGNHWDATTIHNPTIHKVDDVYALFYMGNSNADVDTQRIGLAISKSLDGPFERVGDKPILEVSPDRKDWDSFITTNPAFLRHPNGQMWLYYKSWDYHNDKLRKLGLAIADKLEGPYKKFDNNPIIDFSGLGTEVEDPYVFMENGKFHMIMRDMGVFSNRTGLYLESEDGIHWSEPMLGYMKNSDYYDEETVRFERPQILMRDGHPAYLYVAAKKPMKEPEKGKFGINYVSVFKIEPKM